MKEILGRRDLTPPGDDDSTWLLRQYLDIGLFPVSSKEYFYDELFRDVDHLEAYLEWAPANLGDWRIGPKPYLKSRDRPALEVYARYHHSPAGIRLVRQRWIFTLRRRPPAYPVDAPGSDTSASPP